jgi:hypothetical protein
MTDHPKLGDDKLEELEKKLSDIVPKLQNRENFARSYADIFGELYIAVQVGWL